MVRLAAFGVFLVVLHLGQPIVIPILLSMLIAISFFSGIQLLTLGIMGEYLGRLYIEAKGRPLYFTSEEVGFDTVSETKQKNQ